MRMKINYCARSCAAAAPDAARACQTDLAMIVAFVAALLVDVAEARGVVPCSSSRTHKCCGDGICNGPEDIITCMADCPGVTTDSTCGEVQ